jgi:antibiotic biosynthesis monooxygenase (ABM) superfamily enzyme
MFIHMFAFRLKPGVSETQQDRMLREIGALKSQIPGVLESHVGKNVSPRGQGYVIGGVMKFQDAAALEAYNVHPVHQALLQWLVPLIDAIEVDFPVL